MSNRERVAFVCLKWAPTWGMVAAAVIVLAGMRPPPGKGGGGNGGGGDDPPAGPPAIVFSNDGQVAVIDADGQGLTNLIDSGNGQAAAPRWSPDGTMISFIGRDGDGNIHIINADGTGDRVIANNGSDWWDTYGARWCPMPDPWGRYTLSFAARFGSDETDVYLVDEEGEFVVNLTDTSEWSENSMGFSPDGQWLAMVVNPTGSGGGFDELVIAPFAYDANGLGFIDDSGEINVSTAYASANGVPFPDRISYVEWSPSGDFMVVSVDEDGSLRRDVYVLNLADLLDGFVSLLVPVAADPTINEWQPSWSPDESQLVFARGVASRQEPEGIYRINVDGSGLTLLATPKRNRMMMSVPHWRRQ